MKIMVDDSCKTVGLFETDDFKNSFPIGLCEMISDYKKRGYCVAVFSSGREDLRIAISKLIVEHMGR